MLIFPVAILAMDDGDDRSFMEALYRTHHSAMYAQTLKILRNRQDVDDIVNESCLRLICKISLLRSLDCNILRGYIVSTVKHVALNYIRGGMREQTSQEVDQLLEKMPAQEDSVEEKVLLKERITALKEAIKRLSERDRRALEMKYLLDKPDREIADALGIQANSVRSLLLRARQRAYHLMKEVDDIG